MISIENKCDCCGCEACVQVCPKHCISMYEDNYGFFYPKVDIITCIDCGLCEKVCPEINILLEKKLRVVGAKVKDRNIVYNSSSGGIFTYLANNILDISGVVFGARFDEKWNVVHDYTETKEGLTPFRKSKYVQSRIGNSYKIAKDFLDKGRIVLFTGTPCQIKSLKLFLRKDYENLLAVDIACHSVPSPKVWNLYLNHILKENNLKLQDIKSIDFRDKRYGWENYCFVIKHKEGEIIISNKDCIYMKAFLSKLSTRPSCDNCKAKRGQSNSDLTIADFWGVNKLFPNFYDDFGVSLVLVNSEKGQRLLNSGDLDTTNVCLDSAIKYNGGINNNFSVNKNRNAYFNNLDKTDDFISYTSKYIDKTCVPSFYSKLKYKLTKIYKSKLK